MQTREKTVVTKTMQGTEPLKTPMPPISFQDYPLDVNLDIYKQGERYWLQIKAWGQRQRYPMRMTSQDLAELNKQLQQEMDAIARNNEQESPTEQELENLAGVGHYAFQRIFYDSGAGTAIRELINSSQPVSIQIVSEDFFLPWELIYPATVDEQCSYEHFWGIKHLISRIIDADSRGFVSPKISVNTCPRLGMLTYRELSSVLEQELHFFKKLEEEDKLALFLLRSLDPCRQREELGEFISFWHNQLDLAHFACHAHYDYTSPNLSQILLSEEFPITLRDMDTYEIETNGHPLIIMNACETGNCNPLYTSNFAAAFLKYGARGVVATECTVPDAFAADFAEQLYAHLLAGNLLGESLLAARRYFWQEYNNPSGLLYSMYAPPSIRLVQAGGSNE